MHRDTLQHPKLLLLARRLEIPKPYAVGLLESLWHFTAQYAPDGRIGKYTPDMVAEFIGYPGDPDALFQALFETGWLDQDPQGCRVHDWPDHCDDAVHMRLARAGKRFADGTAPKLTRLSKKERIQAENLLQANDARCAHNQRITSAQPPAEQASPPPGIASGQSKNQLAAPLAEQIRPKHTLKDKNTPFMQGIMGILQEIEATPA